jgi:uncharacterized protein (DUF1501 family)
LHDRTRFGNLPGARECLAQVFFCQLGGFDTHSLQAGNQDLPVATAQPSRLPVLSGHARSGDISEHGDVHRLGVRPHLQPNTNAGTDHAWGNHHFIIGAGQALSGGPVKGGKIYGQFPLLALGGGDDANSRGTLIPTTSVDQYAATLAQWFGLSSGGVSQIFPNVGNFGTSDLGFLA